MYVLDLLKGEFPLSRISVSYERTDILLRASK